MTDPIAALLSNLEYDAYAWNRDRAPDITPDSWKKIFGPEGDEFEARYQAEKAISKAQQPPACPQCAGGKEVSRQHHTGDMQAPECHYWSCDCGHTWGHE